MRHERILKRDDGSRVKITVSLDTASYKSTATWSFSCHACAPNKRTWITPVDHHDYRWRKLKHEQKIAEDLRRCLMLATEQEVLDTMRECLAKCEPKIS